MKTEKLILFLIVLYAVYRYSANRGATPSNTTATLADAARVKAELTETTTSLERRIAALESANGVTNGAVLSNQTFYI